MGERDELETNGTLHFLCQSLSCSSDVFSLLQLPAVPIDSDGDPASPIEFEIDVTCASCKTTYRVSITGDQNGPSGTVIDHPLARVRLTRDEDHTYERYLADYEPADHPYAIFSGAMRELRTFVEATDPEDRMSAIRMRMVFVQIFSALEAFLADMLITIVLEDTRARRKLLGQSPALRELRFSLIEIETKPELVTDRLKSYLQGLSYHDLGRVDDLFRLAIGKSILDIYDRHRETIMSAIPVRHNCVHRNGVDKDGHMLVLSAQYVLSVAEAASAIVAHVEWILEPPGDMPF